MFQEQRQIQIYLPSCFFGGIIKTISRENIIKRYPQFYISQIKQTEDNVVVSLGVQEQH